nr:OB-fold domain-containing protein [Sphingomonas sp. Y57]
MDVRIAKAPPPGIAIVVNAWTAPFWDAAARHELLLPRCSNCHRYRMPPTPFCPHCRLQGLDWLAAPGEAFLYSYTIVERAVVPGTEDMLPYVPAIVEYPAADGVRLITNVVDAPLGEIAVGRRVVLAWHDLPEGGAIPVFRMAAPEVSRS